MNPAFFDSYDRVIQYMFDTVSWRTSCSKVYNKKVNWPAKWSPEDDLYFTHVLALSGLPRCYDGLLEEGIEQRDRHCVQVRRSDDPREGRVSPPVSTRTRTPRSPQQLGVERTIAVPADQNQSNWYSTIIAHRNANPWPVINSEFQYECGNDGYLQGSVPTSSRFSKTPARSRWRAAISLLLHIPYVERHLALDRGAERAQLLRQCLFTVLSATKWSLMSPSDMLINNAGLDRHCISPFKDAEYYGLSGRAAGAATVTIGQGI